ncbi:RagB/SusD family nutrient uptake outer membrane protein [Membranihabitans maritimus]|uniref:RagB/SusD family nutrient uptake outer membrane protein n=1 Tax=Membranihabitans maritimus TaxID=2904244 RepID=UPI001F38B6D8|nr:RagB/SusD family nutrient uptake outer membrane protein [Membranihabitans maritimus]
MKNYIFYVSAIITVFILGCTSLDEDPKGLLAPEGFFKSPSDVEAAIHGAYAEWVTTQVEKSYLLALMLRGDMVDVGDRNTLSDRIAINDFSMDANNRLIQESWDRLFQSVSAANSAIKGARIIAADEDIKNELEAKARFIRGFTYFHLVRCFGAVPYMDEPIESAEVLDAIDRTEIEEVYNYIIDDMVFAKEHLPISNQGDARNIGTQGSASTVLTDIYLTLGRYEEAASEGRQIIQNQELYNYGLEPNYQDLFNANLAGTLKEPILTIDLKNDLNQGAYNQKDGMINLTRIRDYAPRSLSVAVPSLMVYTDWDSRDYRKKVSFEDSVIVDGVKTALTATNFRVPRPHIAKYFRFPGPQEAGDDRSSDHHYSLYRYADVLLMTAEAINETEGPGGEAIGLVNQIRERARFNGEEETDFPVNVDSQINREELRDIIREERRLEFAFEFKRWFDIKRWELLKETFETGDDLFEPHSVDETRDYLFPVPQTEIDVTDFEQNQGY